MKHTLLAFSILLMLQVKTTNAQIVYSYQFYSNLHASNSGPDLTAVCAPTYAPHTFTSLGGVIHTVCHFNKLCGFVFNDAANFLAAGSYTIEMYVELDSTSGYRKLVDYMNLADDDGLYENDGACTFRGPGNVSGSYFTDNTYNLVTITRDGTSKDVKMYVDGQYVDGFNDGGVAVAMYNVNKMFRLLQDDTYTAGTECSAGNIALLNIYNYALDATTAIAHFSTIGGALNVGYSEKLTSKIELAPNPCSDVLSVTIPNGSAYNYSVSDMTGRELLKGTLVQGRNKVDVSALANGCYLMKANTEGYYSQTLKFIKQ